MAVAILRAQEAAPALPPLDPRVSDVVTGGYWRSGSQEGRLRVIVVSSGFEHVISHLYVQWLSEETATTAARIVATKAVDTVSAGGSTLGAPQLSPRDGQWHVTIESADSHFDPPRRGRWVVAIGAPGIVTVRQVPP